jgi:hypothetical protein
MQFKCTTRGASDANVLWRDADVFRKYAMFQHHILFYFTYGTFLQVKMPYHWFNCNRVYTFPTANSVLH